MSVGIRVGGSKNKKEVKGIIKILESIGSNDISDAVGVQALKTFTEVAMVQNVTIRDCHIVNGKVLKQ